MFSSWNAWGTALVVCIAIDLIGVIRAGNWRRRDTYFHDFWPHLAPQLWMDG